MPISGFSKAKTLLDKAAIGELCEALGDPKARIGNYRIHDFKVTCESRPADLGFNQDRPLGCAGSCQDRPPAHTQQTVAIVRHLCRHTFNAEIARIAASTGSRT